MSCADGEQPEDRLTDSLAARDEALRAGETILPYDEAIDPELHRAEAVLWLLEQAWPRRTDRGQNEARGPANAGQPTKGNRFGRFEIVRMVGQGGYGIVFQAWDPSLRRQVALKIPQPEAMLSPRVRQRFVREARAAAGLDHPNIVPVYEVGEVGPVLYIASAFCDGLTLAEWHERQSRPVAPPEVAHLMATLADAVQHAHDRGVLHRDLKPSNILLQPGPECDADTGRVASLDKHVARITDFSLARIVGPEADATLSGVPIGSPPYMAPEQAEGQVKSIGPRTDVYGLGCILYEVLTGRPPFQGETHLETIRKVVAEDPLSPRKLRPDVPPDLEAICLMCLAKRPENRYPTARALAADLERSLAGRRTQARPVGRLERARRWARRRAGVLAGVVAGLLLIALATAAVDSTARSQGARRGAEVSQSEITRRARESRQYRYVANIRRALQLFRDGQARPFFEVLDRERPRPGEDDIRSFAWSRLLRLAHNEQRTLWGHRGEVYHAEFSPDGRVVATCGQDGTVRLWDPSNGRLVRTIDAHASEVNWVAFSPDGRTLSTASDDHTVKLWNADDGRPLRTLHGHENAAVIALFAPDGQTLISCGREDGKVILWSLETGKKRETFLAHHEWIEGMALSRDGTILATGAHDQLAKLWKLGQRVEADNLQGHSGYVQAVALAHDGTRVATGSTDGRIGVWDTRSGHRLRWLLGHTGAVQSVAFAPDDKSIASASDDGTVQVWDTDSGARQAILCGHQERVWGVSYAPDGRTLVTASTDGTAKLWDLGKRGGRLEFPGYSPVAFAFVSGSRALRVVCRDGMVSSWDLDSGRVHEQGRVATAGAIADAIISPDAAMVAAGDQNGLVTLWELPGGRVRARVNVSSGPLRQIAFSRDSRFLAVCDCTARCFLYDTLLGGAPQSFEGVDLLGFAPRGHAIVSGPLGGFLRRDQDAVTFCFEAMRPLRETDGLAVSPDGNLVAWGARGTELLNAETLESRGPLLGPSGNVHSLAFSPDGKTLATGTSEGLIKLWDVATREELLTIGGQTGSVRRLAFSPDGELLAIRFRDFDVWRISVITTARSEEFEPERSDAVPTR